MVMGIEDWNVPNRITPIDQEVMCHATAVTTRVIRRMYLLED